MTEADVTLRGLASDRRWLFTDPDGRFITQREHGVLATLTAEPTNIGVRLTGQGRNPLVVPVPQGPGRPVTVWRDTVDAVDAGDEAALWASSAVDMPVRLVYMPDSTVRPVHPDFAASGDHVSFADGFPLLLANEASLNDLNDRLEAPVPMDRFRPNVVVSGFDALAEDGWKRLRIGTVTFRSPKLCGRCIVTTTDQDTGERLGDEPLKTLTSYRLIGQAAIFGVNLIPDTVGTIRVGDAVDVLE